MNESGSISVAAAIFFCLMMLVAALAIESSRLYVEKLQTQRASDMANLAAAITPQPLSGTSPSAMAVATAAHLAAPNGMDAAATQTVGRETGSGASAATALATTIRRSVPLQLGDLLTNEPTVSVDGQSGVTTDQIEIDPSVVEGGISFTSVRIAYPSSLLSYQTTLRSIYRLPNAG